MAYWVRARTDMHPISARELHLKKGEEYLVTMTIPGPNDIPLYHWVASRDGSAGWALANTLQKVPSNQNQEIQQRYEHQTRAKKLEWIQSIDTQRDRDEHVVFGYLGSFTRNQSTASDDIQQLILQYVHIPVNSHCFQWNIGSELLQKMKNARNKEKFVCPDTFSIGPWKWNVSVCPNGDTAERIGSFEVSVRFLGSNMNWIDASLVVLQTFKCQQTESALTELIELRSLSAGQWAPNTMRLEEIQDLHELVLEVDVIIMQIRSMFYENKIWYQMNTKYRKQQQLNWYLNSEMMDKIRRLSIGKYLWKTYHLADGCWNVGLIPNPHEDEVMICLTLCSLPPSFDFDSEFEIEWQLCAPEMKIRKSETAVYSPRKEFVLLPIGSFCEFKKCPTINISVDVNILQCLPPK